jgi:type IV secretory pathway VirB2 component (pilin)
VGDFVDSIGRGISGLVGGSINALSDAFDTIVESLQQLLPGPLFPIAVIGVVLFVLWWLFKK